ncbi:MAG TPA: ABC transporter substrate-binding protein [Bacteroidales bacterium]|nr:ABC transporter substrate-binding protein [Bacteroidales bacterium]
MRYAALLIFCVILFSCTTRKKYDSRKAFRYNESKGITTLDPAFARRENEIRPISQLFNGLIEMDDSLHIQPSIAKRWTISADGTEYTFYLRNDVYFHDHPRFAGGKGRKVVASDFVFSFNRILDPKIASPGLWVFSQVDTSQNAFRAPNDSTFVIKLIRPFASFMGLLSMPYCFVVPREVASYYGRDFRSNPVGTGPFKLKVWREGEKLVLEKNTHYFEKDSAGTRLPYLDAISVTFITEKQSEFLEFMKGNLDFLSGIQTAYKDVLFTRSGTLNPKYKDRFQLITQPYLNTEYLGLMLDTSLMQHPYQQKSTKKSNQLWLRSIRANQISQK